MSQGLVFPRNRGHDDSHDRRLHWHTDEVLTCVKDHVLGYVTSVVRDITTRHSAKRFEIAQLTPRTSRDLRKKYSYDLRMCGQKIQWDT